MLKKPFSHGKSFLLINHIQRQRAKRSPDNEPGYLAWLLASTIPLVTLFRHQNRVQRYLLTPQSKVRHLPVPPSVQSSILRLSVNESPPERDLFYESLLYICIFISSRYSCQKANWQERTKGRPRFLIFQIRTMIRQRPKNPALLSIGILDFWIRERRPNLCAKGAISRLGVRVLAGAVLPLGKELGELYKIVIFMCCAFN